jgi:Ca2+-binding RTX toxin-like protein
LPTPAPSLRRFDDLLLGTLRDDELNAGYGADLVRTRAGNDYLFSGWDIISYAPFRGEGSDRL